MARLILGWQLNRHLREQEIAAVAGAIKARYQPLFVAPLHHTGLVRENQGLLHFDVTPGAAPGLHLENERILCLTGNPSNSTRLLGAKDVYDHLHDTSTGVERASLAEINPPFTLCWFDRQRRELGLVHDGLGADQFFVAETSQGMAFSNKCWPILELLGEAPLINHAAWQYWFTLTWFPENSTPFANVRHLERGARIRADSRTVAHGSEDTFAAWIKPSSAASPVLLLTRAMDSVRRLIRLNQPSDGRYAADLTGGVDSRAICALLIKDAVPCTFYTGGPKHSADVVVARRIARRLQLDWVHTEDPAFLRLENLPETFELQFEKLLLWGEGLVQPARFQHFQVAPAPTTHRSSLSGGSSEMSKAPYYGHWLDRAGAAGVEYRKALARFENRFISAPLSQAAALAGIASVRAQVERGKAYGLRDLLLLDFIYLSEKLSRWQGAHRAINLFERSVVPFLTVEHIELGFAMNPLDKAAHRFQRYIIAQNAAELLQEGFANSLRFKVQERLWRALAKLPGGPRHVSGWADYLRREGKPAIERIFAADTPLWQILDKPKAAAKWQTFLRGGDQGLQFPLGLMAFQRWHEMYVG